jgi:hypothetical protein
MSDIVTDHSLKLPPERVVELYAARGATVAPDVLEYWATMGVPTAPSARLSRRATAEALTKVGYPLTYSSLCTLATKGEGPLFDKFGPHAVHEWGDALAWAQARAKGKRSSSSEGRSQEAAERARKSMHHAREVRDAMRAKGILMGKAKAEAARATTAKARRRKAPAELAPAE